MQKASHPSITLSAPKWREIQSLVYSAAQQGKNDSATEEAEQIIRTIEEAKNNALIRKKVTVIMPLADWKFVQSLLRPSGSFLKQDPAKEQKDKLRKLIQDSIEAARDYITVTTGDLKDSYEIIGPVYFQISNKGILSSDLDRLSAYYRERLNEMQREEQIGYNRIDWGFLYGEFSVGQTSFDKAFYIAVQELKKRAQLLEADAIISMRQDIDLDTNAFQYFYLQMYGTAVQLTDAI
jgi:hypothetical protein